MAANTIIANPIILAELAAVLSHGGGGSGITSLASPDKNLNVSVSGGTVGEISLSTNVNVSGSLAVNGNLLLGPSGPGAMGEVLTSQGESPPLWLPPQKGVLRHIGIFAPTVTVNPDSQQDTIASANLTGLTVGNVYYFIVMGTYNNRGTTVPTGNTPIVYSAVAAGGIQLEIYNSLLINPINANKINYTLVFSHTAASASEAIDIVFQVPSGSNTISTDSSDFCIIYCWQLT